MVLTHVINIMVEFTHRAEGCIYNLCRIIEFSKELKTLRADFFELHCKYKNELKAGKSTLHTTTKQLYEDYGDLLTGKDISEPKFTLFPALPIEIQYQILEKIPTSSLLYCRLCSQHLNSLTKTVFRHRKRKASDELVKYLKTTRITDKCFGRNTIPYAEWPVGILRRAKWIRPKSSDACVTMPLKKLARILKCFEFSEKQLKQLNPDQFKLISVQNGV
ncbi:unnamed protein product [Bursaphelenchus xylophilus]|uniref:(pine wood nematode) hypothetical protein n=1 Tax=Bursaphelenchus xylophilus TaxID=6326 RepID=A0A1I7S1H5_BURXY|nr:unnamed protein product [Bursaphelenchus xylophilus]CAG9081484.1 unnamed protein product [Bursaphelenchus xylophilus]